MNVIKKSLMMCFLISIFSLSVWANNVSYKKLKTNSCDSFCYALKQVKNPKTREDGLDNLMDLALQGDARAKRKIGEIFVFGEYGFKKDCKKGLVFLFESLTNEGRNLYHGYDPETLKTISEMFKYGICVKKDYQKYKKYIKRYYKEKRKEKDKK